MLTRKTDSTVTCPTEVTMLSYRQWRLSASSSRGSLILAVRPHVLKRIP